MASRKRVLAALAVGSLVTVALVSGVPASATADSPTPTIITVPSGDRNYVREAQVYGETDYGLVFRDEVSPADYNGFGKQLLLQAPDGTQSPIVGPTGGSAEGTVFGDLIVDADNSQFGLGSVSTLQLPGDSWTTTTVPSGVTYVGVSANGIVLNSDSGVEIEEWGSGDVVPLTDSPSDLEVGKVLAADANGMVLAGSYEVSGATVEGEVYVDTATNEVWPLTDVDSNMVAMSATTIFWQSDASTISSASRPSGDAGMGDITSRAVPDADAGYESIYGAGDTAVVMTDAHNGAYAAESIAPDGTSTSLGSDFSSLAQNGSDILAVEGIVPEDETIQNIDPTDGSSTTLLTIPPVPAQAGSVGIDGDLLEVAGNAGLQTRTLDFGAGTASDATTLDTDGRNPYVQGDDVYWTDADDYLERANSDGTTRIGIGGYYDEQQIEAVGANWRVEDGSTLVNNATDEMRKTGFASTMFDDVLYTPAEDVAGLLQSGLVAEDLDNGAKQYIPIPGCDVAEAVEAVQSWLLVSCENGNYVIDQSGATAEWKISDEAVLGNGFVVRISRTGTLSWTSLSGPTANWQDIGSVGSYAANVNPAGALAVSKGATPTIAWVDASGTAYAALLPDIPTTTLAAHPSGGPTAVPATPVISATPADGTLTLSWTAADPGDQVVNYDLVRDYGNPIILPAGTTSYTFTGLQDGYGENYYLTAQNVAGQSTAATIEAAAFNPNPVAPSGITAVFDQDADTLALNWSWLPTIGTSGITGYTLTIPGYAPIAVSGGVTSTTISDVQVPNGTTITLTALSANGSASGTATSTLFSNGPDVTPPTTNLTGLAPVTLTRSLTATPTGWDGRAMGTVDVRIRAAGPNHLLPAKWTYPTSWQNAVNAKPITKTDLTRGATYCLEMRARDAAGNVSDWSNQSCTSVAEDDRSLSHTSSWKRITGSEYLLGTATRSTKTSGSMTTDVTATSLWLVAKTCPLCGDVGVEIRGHITWVSLQSSAIEEQVIVPVPLTGTVDGRIELVQRTKDEPVTIDGLAELAFP